MKKGDADRGAVLLWKLIPGKSFQQGINDIRSDFGIPTEGFVARSEIMNWYNGIFHKEHDSFLKRVDSFLLSQSLPLNSWWRHHAIEYVLGNGEIHFLSLQHEAEAFVETVGASTTRRGSYIDLRIYEGAVQKDIKDFIYSNWKFIKPSHKTGTQKQIHRKSPENEQFDERMKEFAKQTKKQLSLRYEVKSSGRRMKEQIMSDLLDDGSGKKKSGDAIKKRIYRRKNSRR